ncbi:DNA replication/repair protein RecF [Bifidobacterium sp.]|uniref:DNA replication/repair protein RecF n=1 Tax=Bifidobacterium sp. TaxID=41200 RepID=UPI0039E90BD0
MYISRLALDHFRSWEACVLDFDRGINILQGRNGLGKTNIVESIEVLATGSSQRTTSALPLIERGSTTAVVRANVVQDRSKVGQQKPDREQSQENAVPKMLEMSIHARGANRMRVDSGPSHMMRDALGLVSCVSFSPQDQHLVTEDPAARRMFLNQSGTQLDAHYDNVLQRTRHIAQQRVALLKQLGHKGQQSGLDAGLQPSMAASWAASTHEYGADPADPGFSPTQGSSANAAALSGLEVWTGQFIEAGVDLTRSRIRIVERLNEHFSEIYRQLSDNHGEARLMYRPSFAEVIDREQPFDAISAHFQRIFQGELARGFNLIGPQRDDLEFILDDVPAREYASNGEQWTLAIALKMSLHQALIDENADVPIIVLDDVFAQLDENRRSQIIRFAERQRQVLITVAAASDIPELSGANIIDVEALHDRSRFGDCPSASLPRSSEEDEVRQKEPNDVKDASSALHQGGDDS